MMRLGWVVVSLVALSSLVCLTLVRQQYAPGRLGFTSRTDSVGVIVSRVHSGSPAARAGLKPQDRILAADGGPVGSPLARGAPGTPVVLTVQRGLSRLELVLIRAGAR
jgi:S1-C subfamily serine protease